MTRVGRRQALLVRGLLAIALATAGCVQAITPSSPPARSSAPGSSPDPAPSSSEAEPPEFGYTGEAGPDHWGELDPAWATCGSGERQSPIDLGGATSAELADPALDYRTADIVAIDSGHTVTLRVGAGSTLTLDGAAYTLEQLHFHSPGEHPVDGTPAAVEWHFVHRAADGSLAVVALLQDEGPALAAWDPVVAAVERAVGSSGPDEPDAIDLAALLPADRGTVRYDGSLTTPPCSEGVSWLVLGERSSISGEQLAALRSAYEGNARPVQERNDRAVQADEADR